MTRPARLTFLGPLLAAAALAACSPEHGTSTEPASAPAVTEADGVHPFQIGRLQAIALKDGDIVFAADDSENSPWADTAAAKAALEAAGVADGQIRLSIQPLLVRDGDRVVLIDTGAGGAMGATGKLMTSLRTAGVDPAEVTDILISHAHGDHVGGLVGKDGALLFPNATIRMSAAEWTSMRAGEGASGADAVVAAITPRVETFAPGAQITPSIRAVPLVGHTPGHSGYEIASDGQRLIYIGDALHSSAVSVARPDLVNAWDSDSDAAIATRRSLIAQGGQSGLRFYGGHFPFPGVGDFQSGTTGALWVPETPARP